MIDSLKPLILLDGLDEIPHKRKRDAVIEELRRLAPRVENARFILTSRTGEYNYHLDRVTTYEIAPLSECQIAEFAQHWLGTEASEIFLAQVRSSPFWDTAIKPLTLAHLCAIYERLQKIPDKPKTVYKKIVKLLLEEWDQQRAVRRESAYARFDVDRKEEFLGNLCTSSTSPA
jgi:predicted NACHT family NTPase